MRSTPRPGADPVSIGWGVAWLTFAGTTAWARHYLLDDAFIHLRYARHPVEDHALKFNVGTPSYGTSSLAWVVMLSLALRARWIALAFGLTLALPIRAVA